MTTREMNLEEIVEAAIYSRDFYGQLVEIAEKDEDAIKRDDRDGMYNIVIPPREPDTVPMTPELAKHLMSEVRLRLNNGQYHGSLIQPRKDKIDE